MSEQWDRRRQAEDRWRQALEEHDGNEYAHSAERHRQNNDWIGQYAQIMIDQRAVEKRLGNLERFRSQAILLGGIAMTMLGALAFAVAERYIMHGTP